MSELRLPTSWATPDLSEIAEVSSGIGFPLEHQGESNGDLGFFKVGDISTAVLRNNGLLEHAQHFVSNEVAKALRGNPIKPGATVFAKIGEAIRLNRRAFVNQACLVDNNVMAVKACLDELDKYVYFFLRTVEFSEQARATTVPSLRKGDVEALKIPLAPLPEQKRIADKLDTVLTRVDACRDRLNRVPLILKRFRQSVLAAATSGKLTEDWRVLNDQISPIDLSLFRDKKLGEVDREEEYFSLPKQWGWVRFGSLAKLINGDRGKNYPNQSEYVECGIPFINTGHIDPDGSLSIERMNYISREKFNSLGSGKIIPGDLVYCLRGATMGKTAFVDPFEEGAIASSLVIVRPSEAILSKYAYFFLLTDVTQPAEPGVRHRLGGLL